MNMGILFIDRKFLPIYSELVPGSGSKAITYSTYCYVEKYFADGNFRLDENGRKISKWAYLGKGKQPCKTGF